MAPHERRPARLLVLLATFDGSPWLEVQARSIAAQREVDLQVVASDDASTDGTREWLENWCNKDRAWALLPATPPTGSAARNFLRLVRDVDAGDAEYVAFADQDDVWHADKCLRAIKALADLHADGYSSSVIAVYPDGRRVPIDKAGTQRRFDHWFESAGPGCTMVVTRRLFEAFRAFCSAHQTDTDAFAFHDWLIYAFARSRGFRWHIDATPSVDYRQHASNVIGANAGAAAARLRLSWIRDGTYASRILQLCGLLRRGESGSDAALLAGALASRPSAVQRVRFCMRIVPQARRAGLHRVALAAMALMGWLWR